ncbi:cation-transporting P-type ATPase [Candidatus Nomurabacteria bacterium]|nr:cation-transporting P-type ATPase [Candidatus Nomurabacteria bacterium]
MLVNIEKNTKWWGMSTEDVLNALQTDENIGLSDKDIKERRDIYGLNIPSRKNNNSPLKILRNQFASPLVILLIFACGFSFFLGKYIEGYFVFFAILLNVALGFWQEYKADNSIKKLERLIVDNIKVIRNGKKEIIDSKYLVMGDVVFLKSGDKVPADMRLIHQKEVMLNESILTGESLTVSKSPHKISEEVSVSDRVNMLYAGTSLENGEATGIVVSIGANTEIGKIADLVGKEDLAEQPVLLAMKSFTRKLIFFLVFLGIAIFVLGTFRGEDISSMIFLAIAVVVSAVPESLPIAMSVVMSRAANDLAKSGSVVRKILVTQTIGTVDTILTDKTGTLTEGILRLDKIIPLHDKKEEDVFYSSITCTEALVDLMGSKPKVLEGNSLNRALLSHLFSKSEGKDVYKNVKVHKRIYFNSKIKYGAVVCEYENGDFYLNILGAPDIILDICNESQELKKEIDTKIQAEAEAGSRVLGVLQTKISKELALSETSIEKILDDSNMFYQGLLSFRDKLRDGILSSVKNLHINNVDTILCTGDHPGTALSIAKEAGIVEKSYLKVLTGKDLSSMDKDRFEIEILSCKVFARVTPEDKLRILEVLQKNGKIVAVTGDGVNDAPALRRAHVGAAMGSGSDVSKDASDIVVIDDNYSTIAQAVVLGRGVFQKIRSVIVYLLADVFDELVLIGGALLVGIVVPLGALQILFVKFFSDIFPAMSFTYEKSHQDHFISRPARVDSIFDKDVKIFTIVRGIVSSMVLFLVYYFLSKSNYDQNIVRTFIYLSFATYILFIAFSIRNLDRPVSKIRLLGNKQLFFGVLFGFTMVILSVYIPFLQNILGTVSLPLIWIVWTVVIGVFNLFLIEFIKSLLNRKNTYAS